MTLNNQSTKKPNKVVIALFFTISLLSLGYTIIQFLSLGTEKSSYPYFCIFKISSIFFLALYLCLSIVVYFGVIKCFFLMDMSRDIKLSKNHQNDITSRILYAIMFASIIILIIGIREIIPSNYYILGEDYYQAEGIFIILSVFSLVMFSLIMLRLNQKFSFTVLPDKDDIGLIIFLIYNVLILFCGFDIFNLLGFNVLNKYSISNDFHFRFLSFTIYYVVIFDLFLYLYMKGMKTTIANNVKEIRIILDKKHKRILAINIFIELILSIVFIISGFYLFQIHYLYGIDDFFIDDLFQAQSIFLFLLSVSLCVLIFFNLKEINYLKHDK